MTRSRELAELASAYDSGGGLGFRNRIINGDCRIDQRNAGASVSVATGVFGYLTVDRWRVNNPTDGALTLQRSSVAPAGFNNSLLATITTADASLGAAQFCFLQQPIEGFNVGDLAFGSASASAVTLSFWVRSSVTGTMGGSITNGVANRSYPFTYTVNSANTWEQKTVTLPGDTTGTWATDNSAGMNVFFSLGCGTDNSGTAGSWTSGLKLSAIGATSVVGTNGATFYITGVQLEAGTVATPFERRDYGRELMMCQRYYEVGIIPSGFSVTANAASLNLAFKQVMRATPTIVFTSALTITDGVANFTQSSASPGGFLGTNTGGLLSGAPNFTGLTALRPVMVNVSGFNNPITASAEL